MSSNIIKFDGSLVSKTTTGRIMYIIGADKVDLLVSHPLSDKHRSRQEKSLIIFSK